MRDDKAEPQLGLLFGILRAPYGFILYIGPWGGRFAVVEQLTEELRAHGTEPSG
jgi:hypothetical protein